MNLNELKEFRRNLAQEYKALRLGLYKEIIKTYSLLVVPLSTYNDLDDDAQRDELPCVNCEHMQRALQELQRRSLS